MELTEEIKVRASPELKGVFERIAAERHLKTADVVREALREYAETHRPQKEEVVS